MCCFERLYACAVPYICCGILYCRRVVLIIAMLCLVSCELFLKALFTCVFQVELIKSQHKEVLALSYLQQYLSGTLPRVLRIGR